MIGDLKHLSLIKQFTGHKLNVANFLRDFADYPYLYVWESSQQKTNLGTYSMHKPGQYSYIGLDSSLTITVKNEIVKVEDSHGLKTFSLRDYGNDPLNVLRRHLPEKYYTFSTTPEESDPKFIGAACGYLGYDAARYFEHIAGMQVHELEQDLFVMVAKVVMVIDHQLNLISIYSEDVVTKVADTLSKIELTIEGENKKKVFKNSLRPPQLIKQRFNRQQYIEKVNRAKDYICAGEIYQLVLSNEFVFEGEVNPATVYQNLKINNPAPYHFFLKTKNNLILGASPERMLRGFSTTNELGLPQYKVNIRPVAGTYPRGKIADEDRELVARLTADFKERAEHLMLVDLERNDLGRVAQIGSVKVTDLLVVESYAKVHHLISDLQGILDPQKDVLSALGAAFPIGTLTGVPKIRAMEIIAKLEQAPRGLFGGALMIFGTTGTFESCVAIRFMSIYDNQLIIRAGGGIVYDSIPEREYQECLWKAQALIDSMSG